MHPETPFRVVGALLFIVLMAVALPHRIRAHRAGGTLSRRDEGALFVPLRLAGLLVFGTAIAWMIRPESVGFGSLPVPAWARWAGAPLVAGSVALMAWVFGSLGLNLTDTVVVRETHTLVTTGPYRFVRHPLYTTMIPIILGLALLSANGIIAVAGLLAGAVITRRTCIEEAKLIERYGARYREYASYTPRYWPRLGARPPRPRAAKVSP